MIEGVSLSLRLSHATADAAAVAKSVGLECKRSWLAGQPRKTVKGKSLEGVYRNSYCACSLPIERADYLEEGLSLAIERLGVHRHELRAFAEGGGRISIFVSLEKGAFQGANLAPALLMKLGSLGVFIEIDRNL